jgi:histone acetyltransferase MYST1
MGYNLACILTFPCVQRSGYGRFLMAFSYELSKKEEKAGSPEKPLSDLGAVGYKSYWANAVLKTLRDYQGQMISIMDITRLTSILPEDVQSTLTMLNLVHNISRAGDVGNAVAITGAGDSGEMEGKDAPSTQGVLYAPLEHIESLLLKFPEGKLPVQPEKLHWAPLYVMEAKKDKWSIRSLMKDPKDGSKADAGAEVVQT